MTVAQAEADYRDAKKAYHAAGKLARKQERSSAAWQRYEEARRLYHRAGETLRRVRAQSR